MTLFIFLSVTINFGVVSRDITFDYPWTVKLFDTIIIKQFYPFHREML